MTILQTMQCLSFQKSFTSPWYYCINQALQCEMITSLTECLGMTAFLEALIRTHQIRSKFTLWTFLFYVANITYSTVALTGIPGFCVCWPGMKIEAKNPSLKVADKQHQMCTCREKKWMQSISISISIWSKGKT